MNTYFEFSPAARLYAENADIVDAMEREFTRSLDEFFDLVCDRVKSDLQGRFAPLDVRTKSSAQYRYLWIGDESKDNGRYAHQWLKSRDATLITQKKCIINVSAPRLNYVVQQEGEVRSLQADPGLTQVGRPGKPLDNWSVFTVEVALENEPVERLARALSYIAAELHRRCLA